MRKPNERKPPITLGENWSNNAVMRAFNFGHEWNEISRLAGLFNNPGQKIWSSFLTVPQPFTRDFERIQRFNEQFSHLESIFKNIPTLADLDALYEKRKRGALLLAKRGWFIPLDMTLGEIKDLFRRLDAGRVDDVELLIEARLEQQIPSIESALIIPFPDLSDIVNQALELHRTAKYFGSVALFLSLSDSIGERIFEMSPVSKKQLRKIEAWVNSRTRKDPMFGWYWSTISAVLPINENTKKLAGYINPLNRHAVLHGERWDHGTKRHSLKAVSWLSYVLQFHDLLSAPLDKSA